MALEIDVSQGSGHRVIQAVGEVDLGTSPKLRDAILKCIATAQAVGVDLSNVNYMDSSGVATLVEGLKSCSAKKQTFALVNPSDAVMRVLQLARLDSLFDIRPAMEGA
jgi:anti-sigma B factor antagonist